MNQHPDSAASILEKISRHELAEEDQALHALLQTMARDKMYFNDTTDSVIRVAYDYYSTHGPSRRLAQSLFYMAVAKFNARNYVEAFMLCEKAMQMFSDLGYKEYLPHCDSLLAFIYSKNHNYPASVLYSMKTIEDGQETFTPQQRMDQYLSLAVKQAGLKDYGKAWESLDKSLNQGLPPGEFHYDLILYILYKEGRWDEVKGKFREMEASGIKPRSQSFSAMGFALLHENKTDSASFWFEKAKESATMIEGIETMWNLGYQIALRKKDYDNIAFFREKLDDYNEKEIERLSKAELFQVEVDTLKEKMTRQKHDLENKVVRNRNIAIAAVVMLVIIIFLVWNLHSRRKNERATKELEYHALLEDYHKALDENDKTLGIIEASRSEQLKMRHAINGLFISQFKWVVEFQDLYNIVTAGTDNEGKKAKKALSQLEKRIAEIRESFFKDAEATIDHYRNNLVARIRGKVPNLSENERRVLVGTCVGFAVRTISFLTGQSEAAVENCRSRLKRKICNADPSLYDEVIAMKEARKR